MKNLVTYISESGVITKEEARKDYDSVEYCDTKKEKQEYASKYGVSSVKKADIQHGILLKLRELRKSSFSFNEDDWHDFYHLIPDSLARLPEFLAEENPNFVSWIQQYYKEKYITGKLKHWIGINPGRDTNYSLSYANIHTIKFYNKILEYIASSTPKTRTSKDEIFDSLVNKFTDLLKDYKEEYLKKVEDFAKNRFSKIFPEDLENYKKKRTESSERLSKLNWRTEREAYNKESKIYDSLNSKINKISTILKKYTLKTYSEECVTKASEEFEASIKELSSRIMKDELEVDKLEVKSIHDDPKIFKMKITDGTKNLYCRSIIAALGSSYMIPHYRFIITNRSKDDSNYED